MSYTKGEWEIAEEGNKHYKTGCLEIMHPTDKEVCIALCYPTNPNMVEDAQLIASAPELLEACKTAKLWHQGDRYRMGNETERKQWERMRDTIQQVIKKAEGV